MKKLLALLLSVLLIATTCSIAVFAEGAKNVAKVGNTEYATIDDAIAAWTNGTTLTLLDDVTLSDVITIKSTEHHILELGTYTMTAASGKNAIEVTCDSRTSASYALTVNADATNPGGITATGKACIYYSKSSSVKDRPIIRIYNGVFNGSYSINSKSNGNTNCPQIWIYGGTFNGNVNLTKNMLRVFGGTFNGWINCTGDSSAYREISGGRFKSWQFMTADADSKFWVGTSKANYNVGVYVDDEGYLVVGGDVITEAADKFEACSANYSGWSSYLKYSSAKDNGLYYTSVDEALADNNKSGGVVTVYTDELDLSNYSSYKGTIVAPEGHTLIVTNAPEGLKTEGNVVIVKPVAQIGEADYNSLSEAFAAAKDGDTITLLSDLVIDTETYTIADGKSVTLDMNGKKLTVTDNKDAKTNYELFYNYGELTVTGNGTIELTSTSNDTAWAKSSSIFHNRGGVLTIENGTYVHTGGTCMAYVIDNNANSFGDATTTVKGGTLTSSYIAIRNRMDTYGANGGGNGVAKLVVEDGTLSGKYAVWGQVSSTGCKGEIVIKGGNFTANAGKDPLIVDTDATGEVKTAVSGGTFSKEVPAEYCADGFVPVDNGDGTFGVTVGTFVAQIGNAKYTTLAEAFAAAQDGDTIVILEDIATTDAIVNTKNITLDLNGKTIAGTDNSTASFGLITNKAELTITGNGTMTLTATNDRDWNAYSSVISNTVGGKLIVENGTIEHLGGTDMAYGIDNLTNGKGTYAETVINGGTVKSTYRAIRMFLNGTEAQNILTVNGGVIEGANKSIWMQDPSTNANTGALTVKENAELKGDVYLFVTAGSTEWPVEVSIAAAALKDGSEVLTGNVPAGLAVENTNGTYGVVAKEAVATVDGVNYYDLQEAINAAANGGTVVLVADVALKAPITVAKDADVTINLNGYDITYVATSTGHNCMITNYGKLTFNGEGNVTYTDHGPAANPNSSYALNLIENRDGTLIINGGTFTVETPDAGLFNVTALVVDNYASSADSYVEINGGKFVSEYFRTIRLFATSETYDNKVVINDGVFVGQVWLQSTNAKQNRATLEINGGEFGPTANDGSSVYITTASSTAINVEVTDGLFNTKIGIDNTANLSGFVFGGTFTAAAKAGTNEAVIGEGFEFVENEDGTYGVEEVEEEPELNTRLYYVKGFKPAGGTETRYGFLMTIGIDSLDYKSDGCGFYLTVGGVTKKFIIENGVVWSDLTVELPGKTDYITPEQFGAGNKYIMNHTVYFTENDLAALGNMQVSVQGFVTTFDGVEIRTAVFNCGTLVQ